MVVCRFPMCEIDWKNSRGDPILSFIVSLFVRVRRILVAVVFFSFFSFFFSFGYLLIYYFVAMKKKKKKKKKSHAFIFFRFGEVCNEVPCFLLALLLFCFVVEDVDMSSLDLLVYPILESENHEDRMIDVMSAVSLASACPSLYVLLVASSSILTSIKGSLCLFFLFFEKKCFFLSFAWNIRSFRVMHLEGMRFFLPLL